MYSSKNMNVKYHSIIEAPCKVRRRTYRRRPMQRASAILVLIFIFAYFFLPSYRSDMIESKSATISNDTLVQATIKMIPDLASDFQLTELTFSAVKNSIFFIKVSETGVLSSREACSIESAARANPDRNISVIYIEPVPSILEFVNLAVHLTQEYNNIAFFRAPVSMFINKTPLEGKDEDTWPTFKENVLRHLSFYKFGGTYLELDMIVTKSFASLPWNWVVKESNESLATGAMSVIHDEGGQLLAMAAATELWETTCPKNWTQKIVRILTRVMKKFCTTQNVINMTADTCYGIEVLEPKYFYPIPYECWPKLFQPGNVTEEAYAYHFWHALSKRAYVGRETVFDKLASKHCPNVYSYFLRMIF